MQAVDSAAASASASAASSSSPAVVLPSPETIEKTIIDADSKQSNEILEKLRALIEKSEQQTVQYLSQQSR